MNDKSTGTWDPKYYSVKMRIKLNVLRSADAGASSVSVFIAGEEGRNLYHLRHFSQ
jgi:hypothetical protein